MPIARFLIVLLHTSTPVVGKVQKKKKKLWKNTNSKFLAMCSFWEHRHHRTKALWAVSSKSKAPRMSNKKRSQRILSWRSTHCRCFQCRNFSGRPPTLLSTRKLLVTMVVEVVVAVALWPSFLKAKSRRDLCN